MPRRRTITDDQLLDIALDLVRNEGPEALGFAGLAAHVDLAASTIVQRFGNRANLLHAAMSRAWDHLDALTANALSAAGDGPSGVVDLLVALSGQYDPEDFANQLLLLREDLRDPVLRARGQVWFASLAHTIEERLHAVPGGSSGLGAVVLAQWQGALTLWSFAPDNPLADAVRASLDTLFHRLGYTKEDQGADDSTHRRTNRRRGKRD